MPVDLRLYGRLRPYLYHLTASENLTAILRSRLLQSTAALATRAGRLDLLHARRRGPVRLAVGDETIMLRDQDPLHPGNMRLEDGWTFARFVRYLNERVFFWAGTPSGPISYGIRHFGRYESESPMILRMPFESLLASNPDVEPHFCKCNSGSPRWSRGVPGNRGERTFVRAAEASFGAAQVVEVTVVGAVRLPDDVEYGVHPTGPWTGVRW